MTAVRPARFTDRRVVVTGAAGGLGRVVAELFRSEGAQVLGTDVVAGDGVVACDLTDDAARDGFVARALADLGGLDVLCNVAGIQQFAELGKLTPTGVRKHFEINALAPLMLTQSFAEALVESKGNVVSVASISAVMGQPYNTQYCASKAALLLGMRSLAVELGTQGVRVNCVSPGGIETPMIEAAAAGLPANVNWDLIAKSQSVIPGFMPPEDVAEALLYLASDAARSVTGANLVVDRGVVW
ncbi:SDR family oxidoreductase [Nocardioides sp. zg-536]|uniref:SDR family oxidoreductase n=1 Tax=Nocardioides faecalis TaxID=2803858 RepID=A0A938YAN7_9ACTN|nr:SDR family oxidoreductase [Nocardioides faecalis]MBM9461168.1 SDR family oxidoreductase [Nocardioides faecalis]MBS4752179.1 SDR family oxidoreductase [Nocardioides faecalis]QVI59018.1 SDR family oxidoreductase [Nocardioides faecalis]